MNVLIPIMLPTQIGSQIGHSIMTLDTVVNAIADYTGIIDSYPVIINDAEAA